MELISLLLPRICLGRLTLRKRLYRSNMVLVIGLDLHHLTHLNLIGCLAGLVSIQTNLAILGFQDDGVSIDPNDLPSKSTFFKARFIGDGKRLHVVRWRR